MRMRRTMLGLLTLAGVLTMAGGTWAAVAQPRMYYMPSGSMEPTIHVRDRMVAVHGAVHRGSIVVFEATGRWGSGGKTFVKRVVGMPSDTVEGRGGKVYVNGVPIEEPYLLTDTSTPQPDFGPVTVPADSYFVLGDHRDMSSDSRFNGPVPKKSVHRVVRWILLPTGHAGRVH